MSPVRSRSPAPFLESVTNRRSLKFDHVALIRVGAGGAVDHVERTQRCWSLLEKSSTAEAAVFEPVEIRQEPFPLTPMSDPNHRPKWRIQAITNCVGRNRCKPDGTLEP